ncbi:prolipoprotein diacylglyceryl transferase 2 [Actinorhabdospora filicis]|uniref:Phosphatidylglycerol--prolipoprotein diacylglyceryl transferase n=1 Tax=Actinorhabdospora filicis TaxID=1785913 RepID=A0A9W6SIK9_9ACTN|nr:prolipoprotein diacylglyceryl transferase [Actinorhabdospora filicis]GLZ75326.1 prolipoprotein diacylglyceryl transferase 2 [Actinorhabdospora filicis]
MDLASIPSPSKSVWYLFGTIPLRGYALCIIAGIILACVITEVRLRRRGAPPGTVIDIALWAVPFGIVGARIYHVITSPEAYFGQGGSPVKALYIWEGGLGIPGAILAGAIGAWIGARRLGIPLSMVADALAPGLPVAQAVGRLGNWFNQELYGGPLNAWWAVEISPENRLPGHLNEATYHPTFLYELLWNLGVALLVWLLDRKFKFGKGRAFALYVLAYGIGRFWIEGVRIDPAEAFLGLRTNQWMSVVIVIGSLVYLFLVRGKRDVLVTGEDGRLVAVAYDSPEATAAPAATEKTGVAKDEAEEPAGDEPEDEPADGKTAEDGKVL